MAGITPQLYFRLGEQGVDQRIIDELVGHQTEAMRRRYRHLYPQTVADAVKQVFG